MGVSSQHCLAPPALNPGYANEIVHERVVLGLPHIICRRWWNRWKCTSTWSRGRYSEVDLLNHLILYLQPYTDYKCIHKKFGTLIFRKGGDILTRLSWALGRAQLNDSEDMYMYDATAKQPFNSRARVLGEASDIVNDLRGQGNCISYTKYTTYFLTTDELSLQEYLCLVWASYDILPDFINFISIFHFVRIFRVAFICCRRRSFSTVPSLPGKNWHMRFPFGCTISFLARIVRARYATIYWQAGKTIFNKNVWIYTSNSKCTTKEVGSRGNHIGCNVSNTV